MNARAPLRRKSVTQGRRLAGRPVPLKWLGYVWAGPNTLLGGLLGLILLCLGGGAQIKEGAIEFHAGRLASLLHRLPAPVRFHAITFGHVILGVGPNELRAVRQHEHVHIRQYEHWGPFFLPAYALSSAWQWVRGRHPYLDNAFERQAYAEEARMQGR